MADGRASLPAAQWLARIKVALAGGASPGEECDRGLLLIERKDGARAVAFLFAAGPTAGAAEVVVLPLREGRNRIGRGSGCDYRSPFPSGLVVEASQWLILCEAGAAQVADAWSSNLSVQLPPSTEDGLGSTVFDRALVEARACPEAVPLPHPATTGQHLLFSPLAEADRLVCAYRTWTFGWVSG
jgi:hypothetical protein